MTVNNSIKNSNTINVGKEIQGTAKDSTIKVTTTGKDITLSTADNVYLHAYSYADTHAALLGVTLANMENEITRSNAINLENALLYGYRDINLYAEKVLDANLALLDTSLDVTVYNGSVIPLNGKPKLVNDIAQNSIVSVKNSDIKGIRDVNIYADTGREILETNVAVYNNYKGSSETNFVTTDKKQAVNGSKTDNHVDVDGTITAGIAHEVKIDIGTPLSTKQQIVVLNDADRAATKAYYDANDKNVEVVSAAINQPGGVTINVDDGGNGIYDVNGITFGSEDYGNALLTRYQEIDTLLKEYSDNQSVVANLLTEQASLKSTMQSLGLVDSAGNIMGSLLMQYVELPELVASGGNVAIHTGSLLGGGNLIANGSPQITINNNTELALKVNNITIDSDGGKLLYNDTLLSSDLEGNKAIIKALNKTKDDVRFGILQHDDSDKISVVTINGNFNGVGSNLGHNVSYYNFNGQANSVAEIETILNKGGAKGEVKNVRAIADIIVQGNVSNSLGNIRITSASDDIRIQGKTTVDAQGKKTTQEASLQAKDIALSAVKGSISQGFTSGIVNIGSDPKSVYNITTKEENCSYGITTPKDNALVDGTTASKSWIVGNSVYINAEDINLNGIIQSGFGDYYVAIDDDAQDKMADIKKNYDGKSAIDDANVIYGNSYQIVKGGAVYNADKKVYEYKLNAYYNPCTDTIVVESVTANGGKVYLTGRISNTSAYLNGSKVSSNGSIIALDGVSDITIRNDSSSKLKLGDLTTQDVQGQVQIIDKGKQVNGEIPVTIITKDKMLTYSSLDALDSTLMQGKDLSGASSSVTYVKDNKSKTLTVSKGTSTSGSYTYSPQQNLRYNWTKGSVYSVISKYQHVETRKLWGAWFPSVEESQLNQWSTNPIQVIPIGNNPKNSGEYINEATDITRFNYRKTTINQGQLKVQNKQTKNEESGLWGFTKTCTITWDTVQGKSVTETYSLQADNPINISFVGQSAEDANISIMSLGSVELNGAVGNKKLYETTDATGKVTASVEKGTINIYSLLGDINQRGGALYGQTVNLGAAGNIQNINIVAGDTVNLNAINLDVYGTYTLLKTVSKITDTYRIDIIGRTTYEGRDVEQVSQYSTTGSIKNNKQDDAVEITVSASTLGTGAAKGNVLLGNLGSAVDSASAWNLGVRDLKSSRTTIGPTTERFEQKSAWYKLRFLTHTETVEDITYNNISVKQAVGNTKSVSLTTTGDIIQVDKDTALTNVNKLNLLLASNAYTSGDSKGLWKYTKTPQTGIAINGATLVGAQRIDLTSSKGAITGLNGTALHVYGGQAALTGDSMSASVNATAAGNINLEQIKGDMRLGRIYSTNGDVILTVPKGSLQDALPYEATTSESKNTLLKKWASAGIIKNNEASSANADILKEKEQAKTEYAEYTAMKSKISTTTWTEEQIQQLVAWDDKFGKLPSADAVLKDDVKAYATYTTQKTAWETQTGYTLNEARTYANYAQNFKDYVDASGNLKVSDYTYNKMTAAYTQDFAQYATLRALKERTATEQQQFVALQAKYGNAATREGFIADQEATEGTYLYNLKQHQDSLGTYTPWDQDALLYAVAESIVNPSSETLDTINKDPNIIGRNIMLSVQDSAGWNSGKTETIELLKSDTKEQTLTKLQKIAGTDPTAITYKAGKFIIKDLLPIGVQQTKSVTGETGKLIISSAADANKTTDAALKGDIYVQGRKQQVKDATTKPVTTNLDLCLGQIATNKGEVMLTSAGNIFKATGTWITGRNLYMTAVGSIGSENSLIDISLWGDDSAYLAAIAKGDIYIGTTTDNTLYIRNISAGGAINITAINDIKMLDTAANAADKTEVDKVTPVSYIRAENDNDITITSLTGSLGEAGSDDEKDNKGLRIRNFTTEKRADGTVPTLTLSAGLNKDIYIKGITTNVSSPKQEPGGYLNVKVNGQPRNVGIVVNGKLNFLGMNNAEKGEEIAGSTLHISKLDAVNIAVKADKDEALAIDKLHVDGQGSFEAFGYKTSVYGILGTPYHDSSAAIYYNGAGNSGSMNLYIDSHNHQSSNGLLLHLAPGYHVENQGMAVDTLANLLLATRAGNAYDLHFTTPVNEFKRGDLYELPPVVASGDIAAGNVQLQTAMLDNAVLELTGEEKEEKGYGR